MEDPFLVADQAFDAFLGAFNGVTSSDTCQGVDDSGFDVLALTAGLTSNSNFNYTTQPGPSHAMLQQHTDQPGQHCSTDAPDAPSGAGCADAADNADGTRTAATAAGGSVRGAAQRRFRQKQKYTFMQLSQQLAEKLKLVEQLSAENQELRVKADVLEKAVACCDEQLSIIEAQGDNSDVLVVPGTSALDALVIKIQSISPAALSQRWKAFVQQAALVLMHMGSPPSPAALTQLTQLIQHTGGLCHYVALLCGEVMTQVVAMNIEKLTSESPSDPQHYTRLYQALELSQQQKQSLASFQQMYQRTTDKLVAEAQHIKQQLAEVRAGALPDDKALTEVLLKGTNATRAMELTEELASCMRRHDAASLMLTFFLFRRTLNAVQIARVATIAYPYFPDPWVLVRMAAEEVAAAGTGVSS